MNEHMPPLEQEPTLSDLVLGLWRQRALILGIVFVSALLALAVAGLMVSRSSGSTAHQLHFQLAFPGADSGRYPSGTRFRPNDIVASSVLRPLYERLNLADIISFEELKSALTVVERNDALNKLRMEYEARLSNTRLSQTERRAIEEDYEAAVAAARSGEFQLRLLDPQGRIPQGLAESLLPAILEAWAEEAQRVHGAWTYDIAVPGPGIIDAESMEGEDYLIVVDMLRVALQRIDNAAAALAAIPGSSLVRIEKGLSLQEIRARIADILRFQIEPLYARIYSHGLFRDRDSTTVYLQHRLFRLELDAQAQESKSTAISEVLQQMGQRAGDGRVSAGAAGSSTPAIIPQFGEGFFEKLMEVGVHSADVDFRRSLSEQIIALRHEMADLQRDRQLYESLISMLEASEASDRPRISPERQAYMVEELEGHFASILQTTHSLMNELQAIHQALSAKHLQPHRIFTIPGPVQRIQGSSLNTRSLLAAVFAILFLGGFVALIAAWLNSLRSRPATPTKA